MAQPIHLNLLHSYKQVGEHSAWHMPEGEYLPLSREEGRGEAANRAGGDNASNAVIMLQK